MTNLTDYFHTEWAALSLHDWIGMIITVTVFLLMAGAYVAVLDPKRKNELEAQRHIPLEEGDCCKGEKQ